MARLAFWAQIGFLGLGTSLFLDQAQGLLSDAQFTWGERQVMGILAIIALGGCGLAGWMIGRLFKVVADVIDVMADDAEAAREGVELMELHVVPLLGRIAGALEAQARTGQPAPVLATGPDRSSQVDRLRSGLIEAQAGEDVDRAFNLRDSLTAHLRGESLHTLDRQMVLWVQGLVDRRIRGGDPTEATHAIARALDSLGGMPEADPLRDALAGLGRRAGLCPRCGRALEERTQTCPECSRVSSATSTPIGRGSGPRASTPRERP